MKWKRIYPYGVEPEIRHGHRAVNNDDYIYFYGGGNRKISEQLHAYKIAENYNFTPKVTGKVNPAANFGMVIYKNKIITFGGMGEYRVLSNELNVLNIQTFTWKNIIDDANQSPEPRMGHSFTLVDNEKIFMFGGVTNISKENMIPKYTNDLYILQILDNDQFKWQRLPEHANGPCGRESHSAVYYFDQKENRKFLIIFGGMNGTRLGDLWFLDLRQLVWIQFKVMGLPATPRSLHTACLIGSKMYIFGGWVEKLPRKLTFSTPFEKFETTNLLSYVDLEQMEWFHFNGYDECCPQARAGHSMVAVNERLYLWSGRSDYQTLQNHEQYKIDCINDFWYLETKLPSQITQINLVRSAPTSMELKWDKISNADCYLVEIHKIKSAPIDISKIRIKGTVQKDKSNNNVIFIQNKRKSDEHDGQPAEKKSSFENALKTVDDGIKNEVASPIKIIKTDDKNWLTVGIFNSNECILDGYYTFEINKANLNSENYPNPKEFDPDLKVSLGIGTMYAFRITGLNALGTGKWSKMAYFNTPEIGPPTIPNSCKFIPTYQGLRLAWNPNPFAERVTNYHVYIAANKEESSHELNFLRVYVGQQPTCHISRQTIDTAYHKIINNRDSIIFRITACNTSGSSAPLIVSYSDL